MADITPTQVNLLAGSNASIVGQNTAGENLVIASPVVQLINNQWYTLDTSVAISGQIGILAAAANIGVLAQVIIGGTVDFGLAITKGVYLFASDNNGNLANAQADVTTGNQLVILGQESGSQMFRVQPYYFGIAAP